jgi:hypothetical protein
VSFSMEKDEIFRDEELRKHPFWISGNSKGCSDRGRMVDGDVIKCGCMSFGEFKREWRRKEEKQASTGGNQALLKRRLHLAVWEGPLGCGFWPIIDPSRTGLSRAWKSRGVSHTVIGCADWLLSPDGLFSGSPWVLPMYFPDAFHSFVFTFPFL